MIKEPRRYPWNCSRARARRASHLLSIWDKVGFFFEAPESFGFNPEIPLKRELEPNSETSRSFDLAALMNSPRVSGFTFTNLFATAIES